MATYNKIWAGQGVNAHASTQIVKTTQAAECLIALVNALVAAGWTHVQSRANGAVVTGGAHSWTSAAVIVHASPGLPHSWMQLQAPALFGLPSGADRYNLVIDYIAPVGISPDEVDFALSRSTYAAGTTIDRPVATVDEAVINATTFLGWIATAVSPQDTTFGAMVSTTGDVIFYSKVDAATSFLNMFIVNCTDDALGAYNGKLYVAGVGDVAGANNSLANPNYWVAMRANGTPLTGAVQGASLVWVVGASWTNGEVDTGAVPIEVIRCYGTQAGTAARQLGTLRDIWAASTAAQFGVRDPADVDAIIDFVVGSIAIPFPAASLPMH